MLQPTEDSVPISVDSKRAPSDRLFAMLRPTDDAAPVKAVPTLISASDFSDSDSAPIRSAYGSAGNIAESQSQVGDTQVPVCPLQVHAFTPISTIPTPADSTVLTTVLSDASSNVILPSEAPSEITPRPIPTVVETTAASSDYNAAELSIVFEDQAFLTTTADHSRRMLNRKTRPNQQREDFTDYATEQLALAAASRPTAIREAERERRAVRAHSPRPPDALADFTAVTTIDPEPPDIAFDQCTTASVDVEDRLFSGGDRQCTACSSMDSTTSVPPYLSPARLIIATVGTTVVPDRLGPRDLTHCVNYERHLDDWSTTQEAVPSHLFAQAVVNGYRIAALVDSGARTTMMHSVIYNEIPHDRRPELHPCKRQFWSASGDQDFSIRGAAIMDVSIAAVGGPLWVTVCDNLCHQLLLGTDFMIKYEVTPCLIDLCVKSPRGTVPFKAYIPLRHPHTANSVEVNHQVALVAKVPPHSLKLQWIAVPSYLADGQAVLIEPLRHAAPTGAFPARTLGIVRDRRALIHVVNCTDEPLLLTDHEPFAMLSTSFELADADLQPQPSSYSDTAVHTLSAIDSTCALAEHTPTALQTVLESLSLEDSEFASTKPYHAAFVDFVRTHLDCFSKHSEDYGHTNVIQHEILTDPAAAPIYQRPRPIPMAYRAAVKKEIDDMLKAGIIVPSRSDWSSPIVVVKKKDGTIRLCVDYRALNDVTIKDRFPLPRIEEILRSLAGYRLFSKVDLVKGFYQVEMAPSSRHKTAFAVPFGLFEFNVMPFGCCNAPSTFQRMVTRALDSQIGVECHAFVDDVLTPAHDATDMLQRLATEFDSYYRAGLKVKPAKCEFGKTEIEFLGHKINALGLRPVETKLDTIADTPAPRTVAELRAFLGLTNYYRDFIPDYADLASPLYDLLRKDATWLWSDHHTDALNAVKAAFLRAPILAHPTPIDLFVLDTDASNDGIGGVLSQIQNGEERVICCGSRILTPAERNYDTTRRELLAVVYFCKRYKYYLVGNMFVLRTDHSALRWLFHSLEPSGQSMRWIAQLADYPMIVIHRPGHLHCNADALSRRPLLLVDGDLSALQRRDDAHFRSEDKWTVTINAVIARYADPSPDATLEDLLDQKSDPTIQRVIAAVTSKTWPPRHELANASPEFRCYHAKARQLLMYGDILAYRRAPLLNECSVQVAPRIARCSIIAECHNAASAGHFAERRTLDHVRARFWWPSVKQDVRLYCRLCATCQLAARKMPHAKAPMQSFNAGAPFEVLGIDFIGPMNTTARGNRYCLTMVDHFTRLTVLIPTKTQAAETTISAIIDYWVAYYGVPRIIHSDQGATFTGALMTAICERLGVRKTRTTPYRPQADGRVERMNRTVKECLIKLLAEHAKDWDQLLRHVMMAINSAGNESTGYSPFFLAHGENMQLPIDLAHSLPPAQYATPHDYVNELLRRFHLAYDFARSSMKKQIDRAKRRYDAQTRTIFYREGDQVYYLKAVPHATESNKHFLPWDGPCTVIDVLGEVNVRIRHNRERWQRVVHIDRLYHQPQALSNDVPSEDSDIDDPLHTVIPHPASDSDNSDRDDHWDADTVRTAAHRIADMPPMLPTAAPPSGSPTPLTPPTPTVRSIPILRPHRACLPPIAESSESDRTDSSASARSIDVHGPPYAASAPSTPRILLTASRPASTVPLANQSTFTPVQHDVTTPTVALCAVGVAALRTADVITPIAAPRTATWRTADAITPTAALRTTDVITPIAALRIADVITPIAHSARYDTPPVLAESHATLPSARARAHRPRVRRASTLIHPHLRATPLVLTSCTRRGLAPLLLATCEPSALKAIGRRLLCQITSHRRSVLPATSLLALYYTALEEWWSLSNTHVTCHAENKSRQRYMYLTYVKSALRCSPLTARLCRLYFSYHCIKATRFVQFAVLRHYSMLLDLPRGPSPTITDFTPNDSASTDYSTSASTLDTTVEFSTLNIVLPAPDASSALWSTDSPLLTAFLPPVLDTPTRYASPIDTALTMATQHTPVDSLTEAPTASTALAFTPTTPVTSTPVASTTSVTTTASSTPPVLHRTQWDQARALATVEPSNANPTPSSAARPVASTSASAAAFTRPLTPSSPPTVRPRPPADSYYASILAASDATLEEGYQALAQGYRHLTERPSPILKAKKSKPPRAAGHSRQPATATAQASTAALQRSQTGSADSSHSHATTSSTAASNDPLDRQIALTQQQTHTGRTRISATPFRALRTLPLHCRDSRYPPPINVPDDARITDGRFRGETISVLRSNRTSHKLTADQEHALQTTQGAALDVYYTRPSVARYAWLRHQRLRMAGLEPPSPWSYTIQQSDNSFVVISEPDWIRHISSFRRDDSPAGGPPHRLEPEYFPTYPETLLSVLTTDKYSLNDDEACLFIAGVNCQVLAALPPALTYDHFLFRSMSIVPAESTKWGTPIGVARVVYRAPAGKPYPNSPRTYAEYVGQIHTILCALLAGDEFLAVAPSPRLALVFVTVATTLASCSEPMQRHIHSLFVQQLQVIRQLLNHNTRKVPRFSDMKALFMGVDLLRHILSDTPADRRTPADFHRYLQALPFNAFFITASLWSAPFDTRFLESPPLPSPAALLERETEVQSEFDRHRISAAALRSLISTPFLPPHTEQATRTLPPTASHSPASSSSGSEFCALSDAAAPSKLRHAPAAKLAPTASAQASRAFMRPSLGRGRGTARPMPMLEPGSSLATTAAPPQQAATPSSPDVTPQSDTTRASTPSALALPTEPTEPPTTVPKYPASPTTPSGPSTSMTPIRYESLSSSATSTDVEELPSSLTSDSQPATAVQALPTLSTDPPPLDTTSPFNPDQPDTATNSPAVLSGVPSTPVDAATAPLAEPPLESASASDLRLLLGLRSTTPPLHITASAHPSDRAATPPRSPTHSALTTPVDHPTDAARLHDRAQHAVSQLFALATAEHDRVTLLTTTLQATQQQLTETLSRTALLEEQQRAPRDALALPASDDRRAVLRYVDALWSRCTPALRRFLDAILDLPTAPGELQPYFRLILLLQTARDTPPSRPASPPP